MMNRNRRGFLENQHVRGMRGGHDGLLGEGPGGGNGNGGMFDPIVSNQMNQMNQLMLAQQLLQKQAMLSAGFGGGGDLTALAGAMNNMQMMQQQQQLQQAMAGGGFGGGMRVGVEGGDRHHRKRVGIQQDRDMDLKRRRRDSLGRSGDHERFHGREDNRGSDGKDRNRSSRWEPAEERPKKKDNDTYDPAEPTEDDESTNKDLYCHVCNVSVYDGASFRRHLNGTKHQARMSSVLTVHQMKSTQLQSRLKAEEHLRKIEGKPGGFDPDYFCKICNNELTIPWDRHRFSNIHKQRQLQVKKGCGWCNVHNFNNFTEVLEHRETDGHKKNAETNGKKSGDKKEKQNSGFSNDRKGRPKKKEEEEEEDLTIPEFNAEIPVGQNYIIPVTGFFCKLCNKFYNNEKSAKGAHCQTEAHYEKFKAAMEAKITAREAKKAEEAAAAAAEAERKAAEAEKAGGDASRENGNEVENYGIQEDEDYDDDLPLIDSDDEGGLVKFIANSGDEDRDISEMETTQQEDESLLNETSANGSFTFLSGEQAEAHLTKQQAMNISESVTEIAAAQQQAQEGDDEDTDVEDGIDALCDVLAEPLETLEKEKVVSEALAIQDTKNKDDTQDLSGEGSGLSQEDLQPMTPPTPTAKPTRGKSTARRGRGRGRAKK